MRIIDATVTAARRCRDLGRVEARVRLSGLASPGGPVTTWTMLASAPRGRDLRARLLADAERLVTLATPTPLAEAA